MPQATIKPVDFSNFSRSDEKAQKRIAEQVIANLEILGGKLDGEDDIVFSGEKIVIPEHMTLVRAFELIGKRVKDEEQEYTVTRVFNYLPWDGARATGRSIKELFGYTIGVATRGMFGQLIKPQLIDVDVDVDRQEQVPWGRLQLPFLQDAYVDCGQTWSNDYGMVFTLTATCKRRDRHAIEGLFRRIEDFLRADSIYRGKAITAGQKPTFVDTSAVEFEDVVYTEDVMRRLRRHIWANILYPQALRDAGQQTKRVVVLYGTYGTGKTLAAYLTAKLCVEQQTTPNGELVTFIMCRPGMDEYQMALNLAKLYGKSVIFIEDADLLADTSDAHSISELLQQFDGMDTKGADVTLVLTTNHIDKIHKGMLRPGRTDAVIEIGFMDRPGVEALAKRVIGDNLDPDTDFDLVFESMEGYTPAYVREVFDRTVRASIVNNNGTVGPIGTQDLIDASSDLRPQLDLMNDAPELVKREGIDGVLVGIVNEAVASNVRSQLNGAAIYDEDDDYRGKLRTN